MHKKPRFYLQSILDNLRKDLDEKASQVQAAEQGTTDEPTSAYNTNNTAKADGSIKQRGTLASRKKQSMR